MSATKTYSRTAITLHWLMAAMIFTSFPLGVYMADLKFSPLKLQLVSYHKWLGVTIFLLLLARLVWRLRHIPPALAEHIAAWQQRVARTVHHLLYALLAAIPVSGWLMSSAKGVPVVYFGLVALPDLVSKDKALGNLLETLHASLNYALLSLVFLHVAAALKHHFLDKDDTLARMLPVLIRGTK
jgi:cytochrome b561